MQITSISNFRQKLPEINRELHQKSKAKKGNGNNYVVVIQNSEPAGIYMTWEYWQEIQEILENTNYQNLLKASESYGDLPGEQDSDEDLYSIKDVKPLQN